MPRSWLEYLALLTHTVQKEKKKVVSRESSPAHSLTSDQDRKRRKKQAAKLARLGIYCCPCTTAALRCLSGGQGHNPDAGFFEGVEKLFECTVGAFVLPRATFGSLVHLVRLVVRGLCLAS